MTMPPRNPNWFYDEQKHSGVDYTNPAQVQVYDENHQKFRDYKKDTEAVLQALGFSTPPIVIDLGCGTGAFSRYAAPHCQKIYAVDVSPAMLAYAQQKAAQAELENIVFCPGGFLTYAHQAPPVDAVVSSAVLHHLPDFWKQIGLQRVAQMLKPGGRFYLFDVVFAAGQPDEHARRFDGWIESFANTVGPEFGAEVETHIRDEYSTYDWVMEGMLTRAGFQIDNALYSGGVSATYLCTRLAAG
jgi:putative AdoMet-dependent methyltransferase